jgi:hypothetical protein
MNKGVILPEPCTPIFLFDLTGARRDDIRDWCLGIIGRHFHPNV